jgi:predicted Rossmann fold flavoprotein
MSTVAVIGGGPAGMLAAAVAAENGHAVTLFEKNEKTGKKLYLTGKGRCNITNMTETEEFFSNIPRNSRFMHSAFSAFSNQDIVELLNGLGVKTKLERGNRVFPESDKSSDVIRALTNHATACGVKMELNSRIESINYNADSSFALSVNGVQAAFDRVIMATGGASYRSTGSTGDGYEFARSLGHSVNPPKPALIPLRTEEEWPLQLMGLTLKNVTLTAQNGKKDIYSELGELLFAHFGVTGPLVLTLSSIIADSPEGIRCYIDLKPGLLSDELDRRMLRDFEKYKNKQLRNALTDLLPKRLIPVIIDLSGLGQETSVADITRGQRMALIELIKRLPFTVSGTLSLDEAIVTRGGVSVRDINPSSMESKIVRGLYFAGELIDVDAFTGGFNLQIAFSTGYLAGKSID